MKFLRLIAGLDKSSRAREQIFRRNAKAMRKRPKRNGCRFPCWVILDFTYIACRYGWSKTGALLGHIG
jgi:hypothetical protein